ncbi:hypothetical protein HJC23_004737 [Cyclotella cryptica]|uniref:Uncharacterized protein n=1 Tax=Cyclotella cryptica TaxID=29204 RepID=A0ABD3NVN8_9STRA
MIILNLLPLLALAAADNSHSRQQQPPISLRRHRLQARTPKTRQLQQQSTVLLSTSLGACDGSSATEPYKIGDFIKVCITVVDPTNTITALHDVYATPEGGSANELVDEVGDADLGTSIEGIDTTNVTLSTLVTLAYYYDSILAGNDQPVITINGTATVNNDDVGFTVDVPFDADADLASLGSVVTTEAASTTVAASGGATLCSCSPTTFDFTLATGENCDTNDLNGRGGISATLCLDDLGGLSSLDGIAVTIDSVQFLEFDTSGNLVVINQDDHYFNTSLVDGDSFTLNSISSDLNPSVSIEDQLDLVPGGVQLTIRGKTENGTDVSNRLIWGYTNSCNEGAVTIESGDAFGWVVIDPTAASSAFCPASAPVGSTTVAATTTAAATETTTAVATTTAAATETTTEAPATTEAPEMSMSMSMSTSMSMVATTTTEVPVTTTEAPETTTEAPDMSMSMTTTTVAAVETTEAVETTTAPEEEMSLSMSMSASMPALFGKSGKSSKGGKSTKTLKDAKPKTSKADPKAAKISPEDRPSSKAGKVPKGETSMSTEMSVKSGKSADTKRLFQVRRGIP